VYLPEEDMKEAGYSRDALIHRDHSLAFDRLMELQYRRAKQFYQRGRNLVDFRDRPALLPAEVMAHIYEGLLDEIKATEYRVLFQRSALPPLRKLRLAFKAWLYCHGIHG
jgi:phytoene synthase